MITIDTRGSLPYSPLVPAVSGYCTAPQGEKLHIVMDQKEPFADLKRFLVEQGAKFREIYDGELFIIELTK